MLTNNKNKAFFANASAGHLLFPNKKKKNFYVLVFFVNLMIEIIDTLDLSI